MAMVMELFRVIVVALSFWGLCALVQSRLRVGPLFAPSVTTSLIMLALMLGGIARILLYVWWVLFAGGLGYMAYRIIRRRMTVSWIVALLGLWAVYAFFHFHNAYYTGNDSVSHWGLVVKQLLMNNRFPDASSDIVFFKSYPLGSTVMIYYFCRGLSAGEGQYLAAMFMLCPIYLMPLMGMVRKNRPVGALILAIAAFTLIWVTGNTTSLQVDSLLGYMTIGAVATTICHRKDPWLALKLTLPTMMALTVVKSSGVFFAAVAIMYLERSARYSGVKTGGRGGRRAMLLIALFSVAAMFMLWQLHVKLSFGAVNTGKHAVSLSEYMKTASGKSKGQIWSIAKKMVRWFVWPDMRSRVIRAVCLALYVGCFAAIRIQKKHRRKWLLELRRAVIASIALYSVWYGMLFLTYIFSMPVEEALRLASIDRYEATALTIVIGLLAMFLLSYFCGRNFVLGKRACVRVLCLAAALICALFVGTPWGRANARKIILPERGGTKASKAFLKLVKQGEIDPGKSYLIFANDKEYKMNTLIYLVKYEMLTPDIVEIGFGTQDEGYNLASEEAAHYYCVHMKQANDYSIATIDDMKGFIEDNLDRYDYLILFSEDNYLESCVDDFMETHAVKTRILKGY